MNQEPHSVVESNRGSRASAWIAFGITGSIALRLSLFDFQSGDYQAFLSRWYDMFVEHGRWQGLAMADQYSVNYPPLYLYLLSLSTLLPLPKLYAIKTISVAGDYLAAWYLWRIAHRCFPTGNKSWLVTVAFLLLPTVVMNGALWGQCDVLYTCGFLASLLYLLSERPVAAMIAFGVAASLKPQAIFWGPLLAGLCVSGRVPWRLLWIPPAVYLACALPQAAAGQTLGHVLWYWDRASNMPGLTLGATNWYQWVGESRSPTLWWCGIALTLLATGWLVLVARRGLGTAQKRDEWLISLALLSVLLPPYLLPRMHDRYFFAAETIAVLYALASAEGLTVAVWLQVAGSLTYLPFLFDIEPVPRPWLSVIMTAAVMLTLYPHVGRRMARTSP